MKTYTQRGTVPFPLKKVLAWHRRPGALIRITPHWAGSITQAPAVTTGAKARGKLSILRSRGITSLPWESEIIETSDTGFTDVMTKGPFARWKHTHDLLETPNETVLRDVLDIQTLPDTTQGKLGKAQKFAGKIEEKTLQKNLEKFFEARHQRLEADLNFWENYADKEPQTVLISGASGGRNPGSSPSSLRRAHGANPGSPRTTKLQRIPLEPRIRHYRHRSIQRGGRRHSPGRKKHRHPLL